MDGVQGGVVPRMLYSCEFQVSNEYFFFFFFSLSVSQILHTYAKKVFLIYLKFKFNWCIVLLFGKSGNQTQGMGPGRQCPSPARSCGMILPSGPGK